MDGRTASLCLMELPANLNHIISLGFSGYLKGFFPFYYILDHIFIVLAFAYIVGFDNFVLTKIIADTWESDNIAKKESDWARNISVQTSDRFKMNLHVSQLIQRRKQR